MASVPGTDLALRSKRKAISLLLPYAVRLAQNEQREMMDTILHVASNPKCWGFAWRRIGPYITTLFDESSPPYLNQVIVLVAPSVHWGDGTYTQNAVVRWTSAVLATSYSEVVGQNVADALLQIAHEESLRPHVPVEIWAWLKRRPSLPPVCRGRARGTTSNVVRHIRALGDIEILKSYLLLVWSEWDLLGYRGLTGMETTIREEFCGISMQCHRRDLTDRLDHILEQLDREPKKYSQYRPWMGDRYIKGAVTQYGQLKEVLLEVDKSSTEASPGMFTKLVLFLFRSILTLVGACRILVELPHQQALFRCHRLDLRCIKFPYSFRTFQNAMYHPLNMAPDD